MNLRQQWLGNIRGDILAGITVALALIPEAIAFSIIAGVDPMVGLYASITIAIVISIAGGRPGMISAATGAMAVLMVGLVKDHGVEYLFAATVLTGIIQFILGIFKVGRFISFVPQSVMTGFVNALAILIFMAQLVHFQGANWVMYAMVAGTLAIIYILPRFTKAVPSPLVAIIIMTVLSLLLNLNLKTVGDMGHLESSLPMFHLPQIEWSWKTLSIIFPYSFTMALVGLLESLMTATIVDEATETRSNKNREVRGQGIANFVNGFFGGMGGCAMIGQSVINVKSGGRGRLSTFTAGVFLAFLLLVLGGVVKSVPMAALVGVMFMVSMGTFDWKSVMNLHKIPRAEAMIMVVTVVIVVYTNDLSKGVMVGVLLSALHFGWKMAKIKVTTEQEKASKVYHVSGQMFFGSTTHFTEQFSVNEDPEEVIIDFSHSHIWDHSAVTAIHKVVDKYERNGKKAVLRGLNDESSSLLNRIGTSGSSGH
ncbi:SulP family inorganic anion transporter [Paenibacillus sp. JX-17]|uniref:SulP family inorganic anion transporter n=1 Tax=Paenibacillus lacisoli TaxID=3064525 RepID=A0ABT9CB13_9BACL|nr:SulP family inorganic anion transporter [Paenibacillus sp. JX-17]MDO7906455.1 SulP family inorganic anion transporter [Paenibacillus sp. JX-17]